MLLLSRSFPLSFHYLFFFILFLFNKRVFIKTVGLVALSADNKITFDNLKSVQSKRKEIFLYENDKMKDKKKAVSVNQIDLACSGPPLSSNVLNACMWHVALCIHANEPATAWADTPTAIITIYF